MKRLRNGILTGTAGLILLAAGGSCAAAQASEVRGIAVPISSVSGSRLDSIGGILRSLSERAGLIFVGRVERIGSNGGAIEVTFSVQQGVMGEVGDSYTLREWSGRWAAGQEHYHLGQRAMVFLYPPNLNGFSSPVDGMAGVVPLIPMGADADPLLDVRWLAACVERPVGAPIADAEFGAVALAEALAVVRNFNNEPQPEPVKRPLPVGMRPRPVILEALQDGPSELPSILQQQGAADVEH